MTLNPRFTLGSLDLTAYPYAVAFGSDIGSPENLTEVLNSLLMDGELLSAARTSNREIQIDVHVMGSDLHELAQAEAALVMEANQVRNTLTVDPGDGFGVPTVFDTFRAAIVFNRSDGGEMSTLRRYSLTIPALPYGRSESLTTETAEGIPSVGTLVNNAESTAGWSTYPATVPGPTYGTQVQADPQPANMLAVDSTTFVEGAGSMAAKAYRVSDVRYQGFLPSGEDARRVYNRLALAQPITIEAGAYLSFAVKFDRPYGRKLTSYIGHQEYQETGVVDEFIIGAGAASRTYKKYRENYSDEYLLSDAIIVALPGGWLRYTLHVSEPMVISSLAWTGTQLVSWTDDPAAAERARILVDHVAVAETAALGKQVLKTINVGGSARTAGAVHVASPADVVALERTLAFTVPQRLVPTGFRPDLRQWVLTGAVTDASADPPSGAAFSGIDTTYAGSAVVLSMPASMFSRGAHTIAGLIHHGSVTSFDLSIEAALVVDGVVVSTQELVGSVVQDADEVGTWQHRILGTMYLPPLGIDYPSTDSTVRLRFKGSTSGILLDELYAFPVEGDLTIIDAGDSSHVWIDSPSPDQPQGGYWRGSSAARTDALSAWLDVTVPGTHSFEPGPMLAFVSCTGAQGPTVSFDYHKRWFAHAAE